MEKDVIKTYIDNGLTNKEIAGILDINISSLRRKIKEYGLNRFSQTNRIVSDEIKKQIIDLYLSGMSLQDISANLGIYRVTISRILKRNNIAVEKRRLSQEKQMELKDKKRNCIICDKDVKDKKNICMTCYTNVRRFRLKNWMINYKGGECADCNVKNLDISCYDFHHLDPSQKDFALSRLNSARISKEKVVKELDKCVLLCSNCHRVKHSNYKSEKMLQYINSLNTDFLY